MQLTHEDLFAFAERNIRRAAGELEPKTVTSNMEITFPGYARLKLGDFRKGIFVTLFADVRDSTRRAMTIGEKATYITAHALLPTLARIIDDLEGFIVDFPGDGVMAHWEIANTAPQIAIQRAVRAASCMDDAVNTIVNPLLGNRSIPPLRCGIGLAFGEVIITRIGITDYVCTKAIGDSVNVAAKLASAELNPGGILVHASMVDNVYIEDPFADPNTVAFAYNWRSVGVKEIMPNPTLRLPRKSTNRLGELSALLGLVPFR